MHSTHPEARPNSAYPEIDRERLPKLLALRAAIQQGSYEVSNAVLAEKLLAAMLQKTAKPRS